jgi:ribulose-bisphosphate carboxylase large chain
MDIILNEFDNEKYFWAKYFLESKTTLMAAAKELAIGQSIGNPNARSVWETTEMIDNHSAKILYDDNLERVNSGHVWIGFPYANINWSTDGVAQLMCFLMGGQMDIDNITQCHLVGLSIDKQKAGFKGPKYGISGMRKYTGSYDKPFFGGIVKPKTGITPEQLLEMTKELVEGGVDFIKEDEILANPAICTLDKRVPLISNYLAKCGRKVVYTFCINGDPHTVTSRARFVANEGGTGVHINIWSGLGAYKTIRDLDLPLYIHYQKSGDKVLTEKTHRYHIDWSVLCYLAGLCGVDTIHAGMLGGYLSDDEEEMKNVINVLHEQNVVPALSCGMKPSLVQPIVDIVGVDWMANVGGYIHSHEGGTKAGSLEMRKAVDAVKV